VLQIGAETIHGVSEQDLCLDEGKNFPSAGFQLGLFKRKVQLN
jgi:hypothetical protein